MLVFRIFLGARLKLGEGHTIKNLPPPSPDLCTPLIMRYFKKTIKYLPIEQNFIRNKTLKDSILRTVMVNLDQGFCNIAIMNFLVLLIKEFALC